MGSSNPSPTPETSDYREDTVITQVRVPTDIQSDVYAVEQAGIYPLDFDDQDEKTEKFDMVPVVAKGQDLDPSEVINEVCAEAHDAVELSAADYKVLSPDCLMKDPDGDQ